MSGAAAAAPEMTAERLAAFGEAWAAQAAGRVLAFLADDAVFSSSTGDEPGATYAGKQTIAEALRTRFFAPGADRLVPGSAFVAGERGACEWSYCKQHPDGRAYELRGCDLFLFRGDLIARKDAFRKAFP